MPVRRISLRHILTTALFALPLTGCLKGLTEEETTATKYAAINVTGTAGPGGTTTATATAIFFDAYSVSIPDSRVRSNTCQFASLDTSTAIASGTLKGGNALTMLIGSGANTTERILNYDVPNSRYFNAVPVTYAANDSVSVAIPGDAVGFPASTIKVRMAEPLFPSDITIPTGSENMLVRWNASADTTGAIIVSIRYANPPTTKFANEQIICSLRDDGAEDIDGPALAAFQLSPPALRSVKLTRWRTAASKPSAFTLLHLVSTADTLVRLK